MEMLMLRLSKISQNPGWRRRRGCKNDESRKISHFTWLQWVSSQVEFNVVLSEISALKFD